ERRVEWAAEPPPADDLRSLCSFLKTVKDFRKPHGRRFERRCYLTIALAAHCARDGCRPAALDGKDVRCASKQIEIERSMMVAAVDHGSGLVLGQTQIPE
ncbi:MAG: hypothetical protein OXC26_01335, partial [Albidovulum sp.]|nr:hypothetical protein [Albidovulum sp.]